MKDSHFGSQGFCPGACSRRESIPRRDLPSGKQERHLRVWYPLLATIFPHDIGEARHLEGTKLCQDPRDVVLMQTAHSAIWE